MAGRDFSILSGRKVTHAGDSMEGAQRETSYGSRVVSWWTRQTKATRAAPTATCSTTQGQLPVSQELEPIPMVGPTVPDHLPVPFLPQPSPEGLSHQLHVPFSFLSQQEIGPNPYRTEVLTIFGMSPKVCSVTSVPQRGDIKIHVLCVCGGAGIAYSAISEVGMRTSCPVVRMWE